MKIGKISTNISKKINSLKKTNKKATESPDENKKTSNNKTAQKAAAGVVTAALIIGLPLASCNIRNSKKETDNNNSSVTEDAGTYEIPDDLLNGVTYVSDKISLTDISLVSLPVSEIYVTSSDKVIEINPDEDLPSNENGTIIVTITETESEEDNEGATLKEIIEKVYSDALSTYEGEERAAIFNKLIDETIQANPSLSQYIIDEMGLEISSYDDIANLNLYEGVTSDDETLDTRLLTMPTAVVYQVQGNDDGDENFSYSLISYSPVSETASVIKDSKNLFDGEYKSISDLIYSQYGSSISEEAYRDILYAIVNHPANASEFEYILDEMNFNDIISVANITDLNRTLDENTNDTLIGLVLPNVTTLRTQSYIANAMSSDKDGIIYQISPAAVVDGQDDKTITLSDKTDTMQAGDVFALKDVLQYYSSPDGNGRFANVVDGQLVLNSDVNYVGEFSVNILEQVVYSNLDIFTAEYSDENGTYKYGVFDVNDGYDTQGKSLEEIIQNSTIDINRLMNYSFINDDGTSKFEDGVTLTLPQFNYRLNECEAIEYVTETPSTEEVTTPSKQTTAATTTTPTTTTQKTTTSATTTTPAKTTSPATTTTKETTTQAPAVTTAPSSETTKPSSTTTETPTKPSSVTTTCDDDADDDDYTAEPTPTLTPSTTTTPTTQTPTTTTTTCDDDDDDDDYTAEPTPTLAPSTTTAATTTQTPTTTTTTTTTKTTTAATTTACEDDSDEDEYVPEATPGL